MPKIIASDLKRFFTSSARLESLRSSLQDLNEVDAMSKVVDMPAGNGQEKEMNLEIIASGKKDDITQLGIETYVQNQIMRHANKDRVEYTGISELDGAIIKAVKEFDALLTSYPDDNAFDIAKLLLYSSNPFSLSPDEMRHVINSKKELHLNSMSESEFMSLYEKSKNLIEEKRFGIFLNNEGKKLARKAAEKSGNQEDALRSLPCHPLHREIWSREVERELEFQSKLDGLKKAIRENSVGGRNNKIMIAGNKRHGKDEFSKYISDKFGIKVVGSSNFACEKFMFSLLKEKYGYKTKEECFEDRQSKREEWYQEIKKFNTPLSRMGDMIFRENDAYQGIRDDEEFKALQDKGLIDITIWIDRSESHEKESANSMKLDESCADIIIDNNGDLDMLFEKIEQLNESIFSNCLFIQDAPADKADYNEY